MVRWIAILILSLFSSAALAAGPFAAIAFNPTTGTWGQASGWYTSADALNEATAYCGGYGCTVNAFVQNGYVVLAVDAEHNFGWAWAPDYGTAANAAMVQCQARTATGCYIAVYSYAFQ